VSLRSFSPPEVRKKKTTGKIGFLVAAVVWPSLFRFKGRSSVTAIAAQEEGS